ncbi:MAG TPA: hypothetical protein PLX41_11880 [Bacteroidales bacterium]|nr:hypothetical protein [Bacteroidales bacterium]
MMKKSIIPLSLVFATIILLSAAVSGYGEKDNTEDRSNPIEGTWELKMYKYGYSASAFSKPPDNITRIKYITDTHFIWVQINNDSGVVNSSAGGTYTIDGNKYTESIDFGLGMKNQSGTKPVYNVIIEGDVLFLSGELTEGFIIEEIWERVKE